MGIRFFCLFAILFYFGQAQSAQSENHYCGKASIGSVPFGWCIDYGDRARNSNVIYNFHGSDGNEHNWQEEKENQEITAEWARMGVPAPTVITISLHGEWWLTEVPHGSKPALYSLMVKKMMPFVEAKMGGLKGRRFLKGVSMGGYNGVELLLKDGAMFDRVALICPVINSIGPFTPRSEINAYIETYKDFINKGWVESLIRLFKYEYPTRKAFEEHDPLVLVRKGPLKTPHVYISCADHDQYGFFEGTEKFVKIAQAQGSNVIWDPKSGGHCVVDIKALANFFAP